MFEYDVDLKSARLVRACLEVVVSHSEGGREWAARIQIIRTFFVMFVVHFTHADFNTRRTIKLGTNPLDDDTTNHQ